MDHVGLFLARLILTPMLLCICNKYDLGRARAKKKKKFSVSMVYKYDSFTMSTSAFRTRKCRKPVSGHCKLNRFSDGIV